MVGLAVLSAGASARAADSDDDDDAEEAAANADAAKPGQPGGDACIDEEVKADLFAKLDAALTRAADRCSSSR